MTMVTGRRQRRQQAGRKREVKRLLTGAPGGVVSVQFDDGLAGLPKGALECKGAGRALHQQRAQRGRAM
jgi:hypothetical protein